MKALFRLALALMLLAIGPVFAQQQDGAFSALARLDTARSQVKDWGEGLEVELYLSQPVPYRIFTLAEPWRLVLDFRELDFAGASRAALLNADAALDLRFGAFRPGWSRLVVDLAGPMVLSAGGMQTSQTDGRAVLLVQMQASDEAAALARAGTPPNLGWEALTVATPPPAPEDGPMIVVIDPGHGGIDPGAGREGLAESDLMLALALELSEAVARAGGMRAVLTRQTDIFVPLETRITIARQAGADVFISLHADALDADAASGASIYTLSADAHDQASARMAQRHERGDILAGVDLAGQDDLVATVLLELARLETGPAAERLADHLVTALGETGAALNTRPRRTAQLAVLSAADFPSVLVEAGFLSNDGDRARLSTPEGRAPIVAGLLKGLQLWASSEAAHNALLRQ
ncbi:MAG: N-acetylmuramoyl-L-alanine amidase [Rhodobacteraceae bacterium]|nr:N-acetylmuramoyl-L-alanine amidase [Paracoccaceae bacterium]